MNAFKDQVQITQAGTRGHPQLVLEPLSQLYLPARQEQMVCGS